MPSAKDLGFRGAGGAPAQAGSVRPLAPELPRAPLQPCPRPGCGHSTSTSLPHPERARGFASPSADTGAQHPAQHPHSTPAPLHHHREHPKAGSTPRAFGARHLPSPVAPYPPHAPFSSVLTPKSSSTHFLSPSARAEPRKATRAAPNPAGVPPRHLPASQNLKRNKNAKRYKLLLKLFVKHLGFFCNVF